MYFVDVGFGNIVEVSKIISISQAGSLPMRQKVQKAKQTDRYLNYTEGKKTRSLIITQAGNELVIIGSAVQPSTIIRRIKAAREEMYGTATALAHAISDEEEDKSDIHAK